MPEPLDPLVFAEIVRLAIKEDVGRGDLTTLASVPLSVPGRGEIVARQPCVVAGLDVAREVFGQVDLTTMFEAQKADGDRCGAGDVLARVSGRAASLLTAERTALNFLQHLSGIATLTRDFVEAAAGRITVLDTRKTFPGLRVLAKYAVRCGGGTNHRAGLDDAVLIKENHVRGAGSIEEAVRRVRAAAPGRAIEVEAQTLPDVDAALAAGVDVVMLDNLSDADLATAIARAKGRARTEISGGVTLDRMPALAVLGADSVSVGALTHSAPAVDISLDLEVSPDGGSASR